MTPPTPSRDTPAGRAYNDLRNLARRQNRDPAEHIALYAILVRSADDASILFVSLPRWTENRGTQPIPSVLL